MAMDNIECECMECGFLHEGKTPPPKCPDCGSVGTWEKVDNVDDWDDKDDETEDHLPDE